MGWVSSSRVSVWGRVVCVWCVWCVCGGRSGRGGWRRGGRGGGGRLWAPRLGRRPGTDTVARPRRKVGDYALAAGRRAHPHQCDRRLDRRAHGRGTRASDGGTLGPCWVRQAQKKRRAQQLAGGGAGQVGARPVSAPCAVAILPASHPIAREASRKYMASVEQHRGSLDFSFDLSEEDDRRGSMCDEVSEEDDRRGSMCDEVSG